MSNARFGLRTRNGLVRPISEGLPIYDVDAQVFIQTASITDNTQKEAINKLVTDLKSYGVWTKMKAIYPFVGGTATSHSYNLKNISQYQITWFGGMTHNTNGIIGNGTNAYGNTGLSNNTMSQTSLHLSIYSKTNIQGSFVDLSSSPNISAANNSSIALRIPTNTLFITNNSAAINITNTDSTGNYIVNRTNLTQVLFQKNNIQNIYASGVTTYNSQSFILLRQGDFNSFYSPRNLAFSSIGDGLTSQEALDLYTAIQNYQTTLGRQV
jgi:hypothetical protein